MGERMLRFLRRHRVDAADRDVADAGAAVRAAAKAEADHYTRAMRAAAEARRQPSARLPGGARQGPDRPDGLRRDPRRPAEARHAGGPPPAGGRRPSLSRAALRRVPRASGCRSAPTRPGSRRARRAGHRLHLPRPERPRARHGGPGSDPAAGWPGRLHDRLADGAAGLVRSGAIPPTPPTSSTTGCRRTGCASGPSPARRTTRRSPPSGPPSTPPRSWPPFATASSAIAPTRAVAASASSPSTPSCSATGGRRDRSGCARC